ncbi:GAF domain-containing sensor histidine kinase [Mycobacterium mantenii]|uniref:GAF domain-containing sensor histidine kinase n=1 Tax=Mycobacterium mantenii TaxID=560555 RepID=UPI0007FF5CD3|nr:GAF domain-containing protein [Mycobacterium mantenii]OBH49869.1 histidine kinase [Mycobacterium mantenii]
MHQQLDELVASHDHMEQLLQAIVEIGSYADLDATLHRIVTAATELTQSRYGALAVRDSDGRMVTFVYTGMEQETAQHIGDLPVGKGVLGIGLETAEVLRLDDLTKHPAAVGFPPHHPLMRAFLGVPIALRDDVFGNLYVADDSPEKGFTGSDEITARAMPAAAAVAIDKAQLFDRLRTSAAWVEATREITAALLSGSDSHAGALRLIAERTMELAGAEQAIVLVPVGEPDDYADSLVVSMAAGVHADEVTGQSVPMDDSTTGAVFRSGKAVITEHFRHPIPAFTDVGQRPAIAVPLRAGDAVIGVIAVARATEAPPFKPGYLDSVSAFADHAAMALQLAANRDRERELSILADRERIAHDLHDHVIRRLFGAELDLQSAIARSRSPDMTAHLSMTLDNLQGTVEDIRATIFELQPRTDPGDLFPHRIRQLVADLTEDLDIVVTLETTGLMSAVGSELAEHAAAVITQAIGDTACDVGMSQLTVAITVDDSFTLDITADGGQIPADNPQGRTDMHRRAAQLGGTCRVSSPPEGGNHVRWTAPLTCL